MRERSEDVVQRGISRQAKIKFRASIFKYIEQHTQQLENQAQFAAYSVQDAFDGRLANGLATMSQGPEMVFWAFKFHSNERVTDFVLWVNVLHTASIFFEPVYQPDICTEPFPLWIVILHVFCWVVYTCDVAVKMFYQGWKEYMSKGWQKAYAFMSVCFIVDIIFNGHTSWMNTLRPIMFTLRSRDVRRFFAVIREMIPGFVRICVPMLFFLLVMGMLGIMVFWDKNEVYKHPSSTMYSLWFLMMTTETYAQLAPNGHSTDMSVAAIGYTLYFYTFLLIGHVLLVSLLLGVTFDVFIQHTQDQIQSERLKEVKGLLKAFSHMDTEKRGVLYRPMWMRFLKHLRPETTEYERALYFEVASNFTDEIDVISFLDLRKILSYRFLTNAHNRARRSTLAYLEKLDTYTHIYLSKPMERLCTVLLKPDSLQVLVQVVNALDCVMLALNWHMVSMEGLGLGIELEEVPSLPLHIDLEGFVHMFYVWEFFVRIVYAGGRLALVLEEADQHMLVFFGGLLLQLCLRFFYILSHRWPDPSAPWNLLHALSVLSRLMRCWRLMSLNKDLHHYSVSLLLILPIFFQTVTFAVIICFSFAVLGHSLFGLHSDYFSTPSASMFTMLQLFFGVDFRSVAETTTSHTTSAAFLFFFCYYVIGVLIVCNLINSIIIQFYNDSLNEKTMSQLGSDVERNNELRESLVTRLKQKKVLALWKRVGLRDFCEEVSMEQHNLAKTIRSRITGGDATRLSKEMLKKSAKFSNIDIVRRFEEYQEGMLRAGGDSLLKLVKKTGKCAVEIYPQGHWIYTENDPSSNIYIVESGSVRLVVGNTEVGRKVKGQMFGFSSLFLETTRKESAQAVSETDCLVFERKTCLQHFPPSVTGVIFKTASDLADQSNTQARSRTGTTSDGLLPEPLTLSMPGQSLESEHIRASSASSTGSQRVPRDVAGEQPTQEEANVDETVCPVSFSSVLLDTGVQPPLQLSLTPGQSPVKVTEAEFDLMSSAIMDTLRQSASRPVSAMLSPVTGPMAMDTRPRPRSAMVSTSVPQTGHARGSGRGSHWRHVEYDFGAETSSIGSRSEIEIEEANDEPMRGEVTTSEDAEANESTPVDDVTAPSASAPPNEHRPDLDVTVPSPTPVLALPVLNVTSPAQALQALAQTNAIGDMKPPASVLPVLANESSSRVDITAPAKTDTTSSAASPYLANQSRPSEDKPSARADDVASANRKLAYNLRSLKPGPRK